jgi:hypothetical protein
VRSLYPVLWIATFAVAAALLLRPGGLGTLLTLAGNWDANPATDPSGMAPVSRETIVPPVTSAPRAPTASGRPSAWPGASYASSPPSNGQPREWSSNQGVRPAANIAESPQSRVEYPENIAYSNPPQSGVLYPETRADEGPPQPDDYQPPADGWAHPQGPPRDYRDENQSPLAPPAGYGPSQPVSYGPPPPAAYGPPPLGDSRQFAASPPVDYGPQPQVAPGPAAPPAAPPPPAGAPCEGAEILARVGSEIILAGEIMGIPQIRARNPQVPKEVMDAKIREALKEQLAPLVEEKLILQHAKRTIPADHFPKIKDDLAKKFETYQLPELMKRTKARTRQELEEMLQTSGSSLEAQKRRFIDQALAHGWMQEQVKVDKEIVVGYAQMLDYYHKHITEFETRTRARWEQLCVRVSRFPSREEARNALANMGNQVIDGARLSEVARAQSQGSTAAQGGGWDWTNQHSLNSKVLDEAIFGDGVRPGLPVGTLSQILDDGQSLHIIRVTERELPQRTPFEEANDKIKKKIQAEREAQAKKDYLAKLRRETPVWTAFDATETAKASSANRYLK